MHISLLSRRRFLWTVAWAVGLSSFIVVVAAILARASLNIRAALTDKPDLAVFLLLKEEGVTRSTLLREQEHQREYLVKTKDGTKLVTLKKGQSSWYVSETETLYAEKGIE